MKSRFYTSYNLLLILFAGTVLLRYQYLLECVQFLISFVSELIYDTEIVKGSFDSNTLEIILVTFLFILTFFSLSLKLVYTNFLGAKLSFPVIFLQVLLYMVLFAPLITGQNPNFHKDISVTRLKSPLSQSLYLLKATNENNAHTDSDYLIQKENVVKKTFDDRLIFFDSLKYAGDSVVVFKAKSSERIGTIDLMRNGNEPVVYSNIYLFGSDHLGRDIFAMLLYGSRISLVIAFGSLFISAVLGILFGFVAGYFEGITDIILSRFTDIFLTFPSIFLVLLILSLFGNNIFSVIIVLGFTGWITLFRIVKSETLQVKDKDYIISSGMLGIKKIDIFIKDIFPIIASPILVNLIFLFASVILAESTLSFLGLGVGVDHISLGSMIQSGQEYLTKAWWMIAFPAVSLLVTLYSFNAFANKLNKKINPLIGK